MNLKPRIARLEGSTPTVRADVDAHIDGVVAASLKAAFELWPEEMAEILSPGERAILALLDPDLLGHIDRLVVRH
jgi:hypothetical protein